MADEIQLSGLGALQQVAPASFSQTGNDNTQIGYVAQQNIYMTGFGMPYMPTMINQDYYNLFITQQGSLDGSIAIPRKASLNEYTERSVRNIFAKPNLEAADEIKKLPSLFLTRNMYGSHTAPGHMAGFGYVIDIQEHGDLIQLRYQLMQQIPQEQLNMLVEELQLKAAPERNELDEVHWAIKKVNLLQILQNINGTINRNTERVL